MAAADASIAAAKFLLRSQLRIKRKAAWAASSDAGSRLAELLPSELAVPRTEPGHVGGYVPVGSEIDPRPFLIRLSELGWRTAFPAAPDTGQDGPMLFRATPVDGPFEAGPWKVPQPPAHLPAVWPQMILVPLLGFDRTGGRLGQGQGHYDTCIQALRARGPLVTVGLAFACQEVGLLELEPHDQLLDWIVTEKAAYRATGRRAR